MPLWQLQIIVLMMLRSQWILPENCVVEIMRQKQQQYVQYQDQQVDEHMMDKTYLSKFIHFMRRRRQPSDYPFKFEKVIYYAVALYRRYYLVNTYIQEEPTQSLICAVYLSLKLNQYDDGFLKGIANKWKQKNVFQPTKRLPHYGEQGYTQQELKFLSGIKFQTSLSKLIQPLQALYIEVTQAITKHKIETNNIIEQESSEQLLPESITRSQSHQSHKQGSQTKHLLSCIQQHLQKAYIHPTLLFLFEGPKVALAIMVMVLKKKEMSLTLLGQVMHGIYKQNTEEIDRIIELFFVQGQIHQNEAEFMKTSKLMKFKKPQPKKPAPSPTFRPRNDDFDFSFP